MMIPKKLAGGIGIRFRQPVFCVLQSVSSFEGEPPRGRVRIALALFVFLLAATPASARPARLLKARFSGDCIGFTVVVTGEGLSQPNPTVSYNIKLTPDSGEPMTIVDSFPVVPEKDGKFRKTIHGTWKEFEYTLTEAYTPSGSAILISDLTLLHTTPIAFSRATLNCSQRR